MSTPDCILEFVNKWLRFRTFQLISVQSHQTYVRMEQHVSTLILVLPAHALHYGRDPHVLKVQTT